MVMGVDTLLGGQPVEVAADMVVLATAGVANTGAEELAQKLHVSYDSHKFLLRRTPNLNPLRLIQPGFSWRWGVPESERYS
jgi:heterodisulfide reductase subunit A